MTAGPRRRRNRIAVVGGGIGGLAAAAFLRRAGLAAVVYEQASALGEVGAGLVVAPNAARLLRRLPSESALEPAGVWPPSSQAGIRGSAS
jgi:2-polyprenyl-6-methoxyphenol hydroxylase-like FAD-dependent oxidoreductase